MDRRTCLALLGSTAVLGSTGCLSRDAGTTPVESTPTATESTSTVTESESTAESSPTATGTESATTSTGTDPAIDVSTPPPGECDPTAPPNPSTRDDLPDPRSYPERPAAITPDAVKPFLEEYETVYRFNKILVDLGSSDDCVESVDVSLDGSSVSEVADGVRGEVETFASYQGTTCETVTGTDTPTPMPHGDLFWLTGTYYVTDRFLIRNGVVHECWD